MAEIDTKGMKVLTPDLLKEVLGERSAPFDNKGDCCYDLISALHKSVRGSAPDAALYWYARIITAGGDPLYVARRLLAIASKDIGNADPRGMQVAIAAWDRFKRVGPAEGERAIAQAIVYLAPVRRRAMRFIPPSKRRCAMPENRLIIRCAGTSAQRPDQADESDGLGLSTVTPTMKPAPTLPVRAIFRQNGQYALLSTGLSWVGR